MKNILVASSLFVILVTAGLVYNLLTRKEPALKELRIGEHLFKVEIADTPAAQARGLSGRLRLPEDRGMLFIFNNLSMQSFWMVGMRFPLDIIWISGDRIVGISDNLLPAAVTGTRTYAPPEPIDKVLEINAGLAEKLGIRIGDLVEIPR